jgi:hypothetical protein
MSGTRHLISNQNTAYDLIFITAVLVPAKETLGSN